MSSATVSDMSEVALQSSTGRKKRSKLACRRCNSRRIKCDAASGGLPCTNCASAGLTHDCQFINSRKTRGQRGRFKTVTSEAAEAASSTPPASDAASSTPNKGESLNSNEGGPMIRNQQSNASESEQWYMLINDTNRPAKRTGGIIYLGESWSLSYSRHLGSETPSRRGEKDRALHFPTPDSPEEATPPRVDPAQNPLIRSLRNTLPPLNTQKALINAYIKYGYPLYPAIDPAPFRNWTDPSSVSLLLLLSVLFSGALHVEESVIHQAGYGSRLECLDAFYNQAKMLFDTDLENDKVAVVSSAFMLHDWWSGPTATMDPLIWLGHATRLAQNMGMHRSTAGSSIDASDKKLCKRIWWSIYCRDRQIASALGKPMMIQDIDCDVEPLTLDDFDEHDAVQGRLFFIEQCKLAVILGLAIPCYFSPGLRNNSATVDRKADLLRQTYAWSEALPQCLQFKDSNPSQSSTQTILLHVLYNTMILLFHRPTLGSSINNIRPSDQSTNIAFDAATNITRATEVIMNYHSLTQCPIFFASSVFGAITMHVLRGPDAEYQLSLCMIAMRTLETMYPACGWVRKIFYYLREKRFRRPTQGASPQAQDSAIPGAGDQMLDSDSQAALQHLQHPEPRIDQRQAPYSQDLNSMYEPYPEVPDVLQDHPYLSYMPSRSSEIDFDTLDQINLENVGYALGHFENVTYLQQLMTYDPPWSNGMNTSTLC